MAQVSDVNSTQSHVGSNGHRRPPLFLRQRSSQMFILATVILSVFIDCFLYAVVVPVIPFSLHKRIGVPEGERQYFVSVLLAAYGGALLIAAPICGWLSDRFESRRWPFIIGTALFIGATLSLCFGKSIPVLITGRILQGASAAVVWTVGLALQVDTVGRSNVGKAMGYVGTAMSVGLLLGPSLGGVLYSQAGYYSVFQVCFGLIGLDLVMRLSVIEKKTSRFWLGEEQSGTNGTGITPGRNTPHAVQIGRTTPGGHTFFEALTMPQNHNESERSLWRRFVSRLPPVVTLLGSRRLLVALWGCLVQAVLLTAFDSTLPLRVREIWGWESLSSGLLFLALVIPTFAGSLFGRIADECGPRYITTASFVLACPFIILLQLITGNTVKDKIGMCVLLFCIGLAYSMGFAPLLAEITYAVAEKERPTEDRPALHFGRYGAYAQAYALFNVAFAAGCLIGPILGGMIKDAAGWGTMTLTLGLLCGVTAIPIFIWVGGCYFDKSKRTWHSPEVAAEEDLELGMVEPVGEPLGLSIAQSEDQGDNESDADKESSLSRKSA